MRLSAHKKELRAPQCVVLGGGGHASVLIDALQVSRPRMTLGVLDASRGIKGKTILGVRVIGDDSLLATLPRLGCRYFVLGLGGVGDNRPRQLLFKKALASGLKPLTVVHPSAVVSRHAVIGDGCAILARSVVNTGTTLGRNVIVNTGALVEHDCRIEDDAHLSTGCRLAGAVKVGQGAHIGAGATVRQGLSIGARSLVAAGAVVVRNVPAGVTVMGVPAKPREVGVETAGARP